MIVTIACNQYIYEDKINVHKNSILPIYIYGANFLCLSTTTSSQNKTPHTISPSSIIIHCYIRLLHYCLDLLNINQINSYFVQTSTSLPWELPDDRSQHLTPPPQKRIKSIDLYRAQHGMSPSDTDSLTKDHPLQHLQQRRHRDRDSNRSRDTSRDHSRDMSRDRDRSRESMHEHDRTAAELRESLLGQALEGGPTLIVPSVQFFTFAPTLMSLNKMCLFAF